MRKRRRKKPQIFMKTFLKKIEAVIYSGKELDPSFLSIFLLTISFCYTAAMGLRGYLYKFGIFRTNRLPCAVISIGNITVGGTGKTPMTIYTAGLVKKLGYKVVVISRGYKGAAEKKGGIVSDGKNILMDCKTAGDEPLMIAEKLNGIPVIVGKNRFASGKIAIQRFNPDVIILDDAFQHISLMRDLNLLLLDQKKPFGNNHIVPRGILREPVSSVLRSDALIFTRSDPKKPNIQHAEKFINKESFTSWHSPFIHKIIKGNNGKNKKDGGGNQKQKNDIITQKNIFAFSGIADNVNFLTTLKELKCNIKGFLEFKDHHQYSSEDVDDILQSALNSNADMIATTYKDYVKLTPALPWPMDLAVIDVAISFGKNKEKFSNYMETKLVRITSMPCRAQQNMKMR